MSTRASIDMLVSSKWVEIQFWVNRSFNMTFSQWTGGFYESNPWWKWNEMRRNLHTSCPPRPRPRFPFPPSLPSFNNATCDKSWTGACCVPEHHNSASSPSSHIQQGSKEKINKFFKKNKKSTLLRSCLSKQAPLPGPLYQKTISRPFNTFDPASFLLTGAAERRWKVSQGLRYFSKHFPISTDHTPRNLLAFSFFFFFFPSPLPPSTAVMWARESFRQHGVGGCPFVSMHSICVGCLLGSALLWIGHWKARAPWMQSDRCRLVGASLLTACRQARKKKKKIENSD